jgi:osmotically-inducible protein OsmY
VIEARLDATLLQECLTAWTVDVRRRRGIAPDQGAARRATQECPHHAKEATMKSDLNLRTDVMAELDWDPVARSTPIGVIVQDGEVTLRGTVAPSRCW